MIIISLIPYMKKVTLIKVCSYILLISWLFLITFRLRVKLLWAVVSKHIVPCNLPWLCHLRFNFSTGTQFESVSGADPIPCVRRIIVILVIGISMWRFDWAVLILLYWGLGRCVYLYLPVCVNTQRSLPRTARCARWP